MESPINRFEAILLFVDASDLKSSMRKDGSEGRSRYAAMIFFWGNIVYWPAHWLGAGHQVIVYILSALVIFELFINLVYYKQIVVIAKNYSSHYYYFLYIFFNLILLVSFLWDFNYLIGK